MKNLLFSLLIGIAACTTNSWAASEHEIQVQAAENHDYYTNPDGNWTFYHAQDYIFAGYHTATNLVSYWQLHKNRDNQGAFMTPYQPNSDSALPEN
jgi:hypothetical protein